MFARRVAAVLLTALALAPLGVGVAAASTGDRAVCGHCWVSRG